MEGTEGRWTGEKEDGEKDVDRGERRMIRVRRKIEERESGYTKEKEERHKEDGGKTGK